MSYHTLPQQNLWSLLLWILATAKSHRTLKLHHIKKKPAPKLWKRLVSNTTLTRSEKASFSSSLLCSRKRPARFMSLVQMILFMEFANIMFEFLRRVYTVRHASCQLQIGVWRLFIRLECGNIVWRVFFVRSFRTTTYVILYTLCWVRVELKKACNLCNSERQIPSSCIYIYIYIMPKSFSTQQSGRKVQGTWTI